MSNATIEDTALPCPLCEYDLRATVEPRCPECGHEFDRFELRRAFVHHPYLFELRRHRNVGPFVKTWLASLVPWRFWRRVKPTLRPRVGQLIVYWLLCSAITFLISGGAAARLGHGGWTPWLWTGVGDSWFYHAVLAGAVYPFLLFLVWPWITILCMNLFRATLRTGSIQQGHLLRWAIYTAGLNLFLLPIFVAVGEEWAAPYQDYFETYEYVHLVDHLLVGAVFVVPIYCAALAIGYRRYLRLPYPIATVLLNQMVVWLMFWAILAIVFDRNLF